MSGMSLGAPQLIYLALAFMDIGVETVKHGEPKDGIHNFWATVMARTLMIGLLYWGGFFS